MEKVVVGLSGGVDSSVAAATLRQQGYDVVGLTLWLMKGKGQCCSEGLVDAARLCEDLGIPHHVIDSRDLFQQEIIDYLVAGYASGVTPLPCSHCNRAVKFAPMLAYARQQWGCDRIATGHYARLTHNPATDRYELRRAVDGSKDQSYFLYDLPQEILATCHFPLGDQTKVETRRLAQSLGLHTATKPDSQDLCLIEQHGSMQSFLDRYLAPTPGDIVDGSGRVLGQHTGIHHYTIGQRKGLGIAAAEPLYVVGFDIGRNQVIVADRSAAHWSDCTVQQVNWVSIPAVDAPLAVSVQIRYRSDAAGATLIPLTGGADRVKLVFDQPQFGVTPGQAAVWYDGDRVLGGGLIEAHP
ncbi:MAG: tRNA 2-thiouridine(34) synthase MnmA [Nodosilinea sp.]